MLELAFSAEDVARIRFAFSPLWEAVASIRALRSPADRALHLPWMSRARAALAAAGTDLDLLFELVGHSGGYIPDFLTPPPDTPVPRFDAELAAVRATGLGQVRRDLDRMRRPPGPASVALRRDPAAGLSQLSDQLDRYWKLTMAPAWPRMRGLLEGDVSYRVRRFALGGTQLLFDDLHDGVRWRSGRLYVDHRHYSYQGDLDGCGLLLVPSVFAWPHVFSITAAPWQPTLLYPPRGVATLWEIGTAAGPDGLAGVLGRSRAALLAELPAPASTTELARRTELSPGGVSQHLAALRRAGLVVGHRVGRSVLYARTEAADTLLRAAGA